MRELEDVKDEGVSERWIVPLPGSFSLKVEVSRGKIFKQALPSLDLIL